MFEGISPDSGAVVLAVLGIGALLAGVMFNQVIPWYDVWVAWVATTEFSGGTQTVLKQVPAGMVLGEILVIMALASPVAVRIGR